WDSKAGKAKGNSEAARTLNAYIDLVKGDIHKHYNKLLGTGVAITADTVKNSYQGISDQKSLIEVFEYHNDLFKQRIGVDVSERTHKKFKTVLVKVREYLKMERNRQDVLLRELNYQFIEGFAMFLKTRQKMGHNTTMKYVQSVRTVINLAI